MKTAVIYHVVDTGDVIVFDDTGVGSDESGIPSPDAIYLPEYSSFAGEGLESDFDDLAPTAGAEFGAAADGYATYVTQTVSGLIQQTHPEVF